jgi:hypothetical protein
LTGILFIFCMIPISFRLISAHLNGNINVSELAFLNKSAIRYRIYSTRLINFDRGFQIFTSVLYIILCPHTVPCLESTYFAWMWNLATHSEEGVGQACWRTECQVEYTKNVTAHGGNYKQHNNFYSSYASSVGWSVGIVRSRTKGHGVFFFCLFLCASSVVICLDDDKQWTVASSGMLRRVAVVRTDVLEELSSSIIRVTRISELGTTLAVTSNRRTLRSRH